MFTITTPSQTIPAATLTDLRDALINEAEENGRIAGMSRDWFDQINSVYPLDEDSWEEMTEEEKTTPVREVTEALIHQLACTVFDLAPSQVTITELADELDEVAQAVARAQDITLEAARGACETYLTQSAQADAVDYDPNDLPAELAVFIFTAASEHFDIEVDAMMADIDALAQEITVMEVDLDSLRSRRDQLIVRAAKRGASKADLVRASGLSRGYIYKLIDNA